MYADVEVNEDWLEESLSNDEDLFTSLVKQPDTNDMDCESSSTDELSTQEPIGDSDTNMECKCISTGLSASSAPKPMTKDMECVSSSLSIADDNFTSASNILETLASTNGFTIHDVPYDGDCLFSTITYQLQSIGIYNGSKDELRKIVADHLDENSTFYRNYTSQPLASHDPYNADTEAPTAEDAYIATIVDPELRAQLCWEKYLRRLRDGAWGDHVVIQGICNMFNITINVLSTQNSTMIPIVPMSHASEHTLYIGLLMQYHYVGLDKVPNNDEASNVDNIENPLNDATTSKASDDINDTTTSEADNPLDDATIEEGDEHTRQITGGPQASMMSLNNPEAFGQIVSVAPAEGQKPLAIMTDSNFEAMCNPDKFCFGTGAFNTDRPRKLTYRKYFNQRLLDVDGKFVKDLDYLFVAQYIVEAKQVLDDANNFIWRQKPSRQFTASQVKDQALLSQCMRKDKAYRFMKNIRGSPPYYQRTFYDLLAMIHQLGTPTWFFYPISC